MPTTGARQRPIYVDDLPEPIVVDLDNDLEAEDDFRDEDELIYQGLRSNASLRHGLKRNGLIRNGPISHPDLVQDTMMLSDGTILVPGYAVELRTLETKLPSHLFVQSILRNATTGLVSLRGLTLFSNRLSRGMFDNKRDEVYLRVEVDEDDERPWMVQGAVDIPASTVSRSMQIVFSTSSYPSDSAADGSHLTCRRVLLESFTDSEHRIKRRPKSWIRYELRQLCSCDVAKLTGHDHEAHLCQMGTATPLTGEQRSLSYCSCFAGGGGDANGAQQAGADIVATIERDEVPCRTLRLNFPATKVVQDSIENISRHLQTVVCDICHVSFPCQSHSSLTGRIVTEAAIINSAASLSCAHIVTRGFRRKPSYITVENVSGLVWKGDSRPYFHTMIRSFAENGYNLRWGLFDFTEYGLPARRLRFVLFGARHGLPLPTFPKPTHGPRGSRPFVTRLEALESLRRVPVTHNDPQNRDHCSHFLVPRAAYPRDTDTPLLCVTTNGGDGNYHWDGTRTFTVRELATLSGFPVDYRFPQGVGKGALEKQIGNSIPPFVWKVFIAQIIKSSREYAAGLIDSHGKRVTDDAARAPRSPVVDLTMADDGEQSTDWPTTSSPTAASVASVASSATLVGDNEQSPPATPLRATFIDLTLAD